jgi:hypothetical protein
VQKRNEKSLLTMGREMTEAAYRWQISLRSSEQYDVLEF